MRAPKDGSRRFLQELTGKAAREDGLRGKPLKTALEDSFVKWPETIALEDSSEDGFEKQPRTISFGKEPEMIASVDSFKTA